MSDEKTASLPTHTRHQPVSGPSPVLAAHPAENHRWVRSRGQPGTTGRGSLIKRAREPAVEASGQQNVYRPATRRPLVETARQHHHSRSRGLGPVRTEPDDHAERAARPESRGRLTLPAIRTPPGITRFRPYTKRANVACYGTSSRRGR